MKLSPWILCTCLASFFSFIKRTLFRFRRRRTSDAGLPTKGPGPGAKPTPVASVNGAGNQTYGSPQALDNSGIDLAWDDWGDGAPMSIKIDPTTPTVGGAPQTYTQMAPPHGAGGISDEEEEPAVDYFADMLPSYKKPAKIRKKIPSQMINGPPPLTQGLSNRLTMGVDETAVLTDELGAWTEENNAWEDDTGEDLAWEAEQVIREKKLAERERRAAEQRRKKMEKEAQRNARKDSGKLATKLK